MWSEVDENMSTACPEGVYIQHNRILLISEPRHGRDRQAEVREKLHFGRFIEADEMSIRCCWCKGTSGSGEKGQIGSGYNFEERRRADDM